MAERIERRPQSGTSASWFALAALPFLVLVAIHWPLGPLAALGDWSQYMLHADALYRGRSYTDTGYIFTSLNPFIGPQAQPPGLPAILVPVIAATGATRDLTIYKLLMVVFSLAFLACAFVYFRRRASLATAAATVMVTGLWLEVSFVTNVVQPDVGFCAMVWGILCIADRESRWNATDVAAVAVLGLAALSFRVAAAPLVPALAVYALLQRRKVGWGPMVPVAIWGACGLLAAVAAPSTLMFARLIDPARFADNLIEAAKAYPLATVELFLYPFPWNRANDVYHLVVGVFAVVGVVDWIRREYRGMLVWFTAFYVGMLVVLPMQDVRYLMPLAPLVVFTAWNGMVIVLRKIAARVASGTTLRIAERLPLAAAATVCALTLVNQVRQPSPPVLLDVPGVASIFSLLRNQQRESPVRAVFVNPRVLTWATGVPAMGFFDASPDSTLAEFRAKGITHVVVGDVGIDPRHAPFIARAVTERPQAFRSVFAEGVFTVYRFDSTRAPSP